MESQFILIHLEMWWTCSKESILKSVNWTCGKASKNAFWNWLALLTKLSLYAFLNGCDDRPNLISQLLLMFLFCIHFFHSSICLSPAFLKAAYRQSLVSAESDDITRDFLFALTTVHNSNANLISHIIYFEVIYSHISQFDFPIQLSSSRNPSLVSFSVILFILSRRRGDHFLDNKYIPILLLTVDAEKGLQPNQKFVSNSSPISNYYTKKKNTFKNSLLIIVVVFCIFCSQNGDSLHDITWHCTLS